MTALSALINKRTPVSRVLISERSTLSFGLHLVCVMGWRRVTLVSAPEADAPQDREVLPRDVQQGGELYNEKHFDNHKFALQYGGDASIR